MALKHVNAVVVGSGAGGGIVAKELAEAGLSVVLLERGKWFTSSDDRKDDLRNQRTRALGASFGPDERNPRVYVDEFGRGACHSVEPLGLQQQCRVCRRRHAELRRDGVALHGAGFPPALDVWSRRRQHAG